MNDFIEFHFRRKTRNVRRCVYLFLILFSTFYATGCASTAIGVDAATTGQNAVVADEFNEFDEFDESAAPEFYDPLEGYNRFMFSVNDKLYVWVLRPVSGGYAFIVPEPARVSVKSFFKNLLFPVRFVNNLLQLKFKKSGMEIARFGINSTLGLAGLFDPATAWFHINESKEDFGQTLGHYGLGGGIPIVLPLFGPSNLRDAFSRIPDSFLNPINYVTPIEASLGANGFEKINKVSLYSGEYDELKKQAIDPYVFFRNAYKQNRAKKVKE